jgi:hypothetical protein
MIRDFGAPAVAVEIDFLPEKENHDHLLLLFFLHEILMNVQIP